MQRLNSVVLTQIGCLIRTHSSGLHQLAEDQVPHYLYHPKQTVNFYTMSKGDSLHLSYLTLR